MKGRRGFVLALALMALVLIAVLVTGALFAAGQETHATEAQILQMRAAAYAERVALEEIASWRSGACDSLRVGAVIIASPPANPPFEASVYVTRLDSAVFLVVGEGRIASGGAIRIRRRVAITVRTARDANGIARALRVSEQAWSALYQM